MKKFLVILLIVTLALSTLALTACDTVLDADDMLTFCNKSLDPIVATDGVEVVVYADLYAMAVHNIPGDKITVQYVHHDEVSVTSTLQDNGNVVIKQESHGTVLHIGDLYLVIGIPESWTNYTLAVKGTVGSLSVEDSNAYWVQVEMTTGAVNIETESATVVKVDVSTGAVKVEGTAQLVDVDTDTGAINVDMDVAKLSLSSDTGSIKFEVENNLEIDVECDTGSIRGKIEGVKTQYSIEVEVGMGSCNLKNQAGDGVHKLEIDVDTGSANIKFEK